MRGDENTTEEMMKVTRKEKTSSDKYDSHDLNVEKSDVQGTRGKMRQHENYFSPSTCN